MACNQWASACGRAHACLPACAEASWLQCFAPGNKPCRADSPAGWLLQGDRDPEGARHRLWTCGRQACKRFVRGNGRHLRRRFAGRPAPTNTKTRLFPCRSLPASESCRATGITSGEDSPAGRLLQRQPHLVFVGDKPASETCRSTSITSGEDSPAGRLLQIQRPGFSLVGACLQANRAGQRASPPATIRRQAGSYKGSRILSL